MVGTTAPEPILFTRAVPAPEALPADLLAECFAAAVRRDPVGVLQYGQPGGYLPLRRVLAGQYGVGEDELFVANGSLQVMDLLAAHLVHPGDTVVVEQPTYDHALSTFRRRGARVIGIPLEDDGLDVARLEAEVRRQTPAFFYTIPDFQNPSGTTLSAAKRRRVVELATRYGFWVLEDVQYRALRYRGAAPPLLREIDTSRVLTMSSHSQLIAPALRVGHVVAPAPVAAALAQIAVDTYLAPVHPAQAMLAEYLRNGWLSGTIERLKALYLPRWQAMVAAVQTHLLGMRFVESDGGFFLSITFPPDANTPGLHDRARQAGLLLSDGRIYFADPYGSDQPEQTEQPERPARQAAPEAERFIRLPFCAVTPQEIDEGMRRLAYAVSWRPPSSGSSDPAADDSPSPLGTAGDVG